MAVENVIEARARVGKVGLAEIAYALYDDAIGDERQPEPPSRRSSSGANPEARAARRRPIRARPIRRPGGRVDRRVRDAGPHLARRFAFLLVTGEAGIGKTRVLQEIERDAVLRGYRCLHASPVELESAPSSNPIVDALRPLDLEPHLEALGPPWSTVVSTVLPAGMYDDWAGELPPIQEGSLSRRLLDAVSRCSWTGSQTRHRPCSFSTTCSGPTTRRSRRFSSSNVAGEGGRSPLSPHCGPS